MNTKTKLKDLKYQVNGIDSPRPLKECIEAICVGLLFPILIITVIIIADIIIAWS